MEIAYVHPDIPKFFDSLETPMRAKVFRLTELLSIEAYHLGMPYSRKVEKNLYELRARTVQNVRIFYTFYDGKIILLHAVHKKTKKLTMRDLDTARQRLRALHER